MKKITEQEIYEVICQMRDFFVTENFCEYGFCFVLSHIYKICGSDKKPCLAFIRKYGNFHKRIFFECVSSGGAKTKDNAQFWFPQRQVQPRIDLLNKAISNYESLHL